jgi:mono/diheme cytochrome c family protein
MPSWKLRYSEEDRWKVVYYIRVNFTQTLERPSTTVAQTYPDIYLTQTMPTDVPISESVDGNVPVVYPVTPTYSSGKLVYLENCAHCHGLSGQGDGWDGQYLDVAPANFTDSDVAALTDGDFYARVSYGLQNTAMPTWGEFLPQSERWDAIKFIQDSFIIGTKDKGSLYSDKIANNVLTLSSDNWTGEGNIISPEDGKPLYGQYCAECHGDDGQANTPGTASLPSGAPVAYPADLPIAYVFWRVWEGVPDEIMPPFNWLISETDIWNISAYVQQLTSTSQGGQ